MLIELSSKFLFAVWLLAAGSSPGFLASLYGVRIASSLGIAPFIQPLVKQQKGIEFLFASAAGVSGWLLLTLTRIESFSALLGVFLLGIASFSYVTGLESRWYTRRSLSQIPVRELVLTFVRIIAVPVLSWLIFFHHNVYALTALLSCLLAAPYGIWLVKSVHESEV